MNFNTIFALVPSIEVLDPNTDFSILWVLLSGILVFFMQAGFTLVESGFTKSSNAVNISMKNILDISVGTLSFWFIGYGLMYGGSSNGFIITEMSDLLFNPGAGAEDVFFQTVFCATAATIVSGAIAGRTKYSTYALFTIIMTALIYPIAGGWEWNGGWLNAEWMPAEFIDFAGSSIVHSVGGWGALVVIYFLGARKGKFDENGNPLAITGSNIPLSAAGVLILWLGWFGFNGGSVLSADPSLTSLTLVTTCLAAAAGGIGAAVLSRFLYNNLDLTMFMNGVLGGLVGITAGADQMLPTSAILIGLIAGCIVVLSVALLDKCKLDDPVGAIPVHLFCGIWGTLAVGIFGEMAGLDQFMVQIACVGINGAFCIVLGTIITLFVRSVAGLRVDEKEEIQGLDIAEHGTTAYGDFRVN